MKIGLVSKFPPEECGIGIYTKNLAEALKAAGTSVVTIGSLASDASYRIDFDSFFLKEKLQDIVEKESLDVLHIQYIPPYFGRLMANQNLVRALHQKVPVLVTFHEVQYETAGIRAKVLKFIEIQILRRAAKVIVHSPLQKKFLDGKGYANVENILMGIHPLQVNPRKNRVLLCFGIISREKGHKYLLEAVKSLPEYHLILAGKPVDAAYEHELREFVEKNHLPNVTLDFGWISEEKKDAYYKASSILVLPYLWGPYTSAVVHDAMSYNMPVIVTKVGAVWEIVDIFRTGKVIPPQDPRAICSAVKDVEKNFGAYLKNIAAYRKKAGWDELAKSYKKLYGSTVKG